MKKISLIILCFLFPLTSFAAAKPKPAKTPKPTVASLTKQLKEATGSIEELQAEKVSLTAKVASLETQLKDFRTASDKKFMITAGTGAAAVAVCIIIILSMTGVKAVSGRKKKKTGEPPSVEEHFSDIEYHVLDDWHNIFYHPERIDRGLYDDLANHFGQLHTNIEKWKSDIERRDKLVVEMIKDLSMKFKEVEATTSIHMLALPENEPFIEDNEIAIGSFICAHLKEGYNADSGLMQTFYNAVMKMFDTSYAEVKTLSNEIADLKNDVDVEIRKIKHHRKLTGDCKYLHVSQ